MPTLFNTTIDYVALLDALSNAEEMTDEQMTALMDLQGALVDKLDAYGCVIAELTAKADQLANEAARLSDWKRQVQSNIDRMKRAVAESMQATSADKVETAHWRYSFRKSKSVEVDADKFTEWAQAKEREDLLRVTYAVDKTKIKAALDKGEDIPAVIVEKQSLQIK